MNTFFKLAFLSMAGFGALACSHDSTHASSAASENRRADAPGGTMTAASGTHSAAEQIASARCEREQKCGNIGADKTYSSSQDCLARIRADWQDDLNARECPGGVNVHELNECLDQVRAEACGNPFDKLARMTECTQGQICIE
jgi:hypothetical protein